MDCGDLMSFDLDVPTGILIDVSPIRPTRSTVKTTSSSPARSKSCDAKVGNLLDGFELELANSKPAVVAESEQVTVEAGAPQQASPAKADHPTEKELAASRLRQPSLSSLLDFDDEGGFMNETPPSLDSTPPDSPAIHQNEAVAAKLATPVPDFNKIAEESQHILAWMKGESQYSIGDQVIYKTANYSATRSSKRSDLPDLNDVVRRYRRLSSAISTPSCDDQTAAAVKSSPVAKVKPVIKRDLPQHKSSLKQNAKIPDISDPSGIRSKTTHAHLHHTKKSVAFEDAVAHSPEVTKKIVLPRMLNLSHPHSSKENAKPVAKVGPMKAVRPLATMVKPALAKEGGVTEAKKLKPLGATGQIPGAVPGRQIGHHPMKRRSGSVDRVTAGMKAVTLSSPSVNRIARAGVQTRLRSSSSNRVGVPAAQAKK